MKLCWFPKMRAIRALWMAEELGKPRERGFIDIRDPTPRSDPAFGTASPMRGVPAREDCGTRLRHSGAICDSLADQYPRAAVRDVL
jgi:glutathione S-transferase